MKNKKINTVIALLVASLLVVGCNNNTEIKSSDNNEKQVENEVVHERDSLDEAQEEEILVDEKDIIIIDDTDDVENISAEQEQEKDIDYYKRNMRSLVPDTGNMIINMSNNINGKESVCNVEHLDGIETMYIETDDYNILTLTNPDDNYQYIKYTLNDIEREGKIKNSSNKEYNVNISFSFKNVLQKIISYDAVENHGDKTIVITSMYNDGLAKQQVEKEYNANIPDVVQVNFCFDKETDKFYGMQYNIDVKCNNNSTMSSSVLYKPITKLKNDIRYIDNEIKEDDTEFLGGLTEILMNSADLIN